MKGGRFTNPPWTEAELAPLRAALADPNRPSKYAMAKILSPQVGRTVDAVAKRLEFLEDGGRPSRVGQDSKPGTTRPDFRTQRCLKCRTVKRLPQGIFLCDGCKRTPEWRAARMGSDTGGRHARLGDPPQSPTEERLRTILMAIDGAPIAEAMQVLQGAVVTMIGNVWTPDRVPGAMRHFAGLVISSIPDAVRVSHVAETIDAGGGHA